MKTDTTDTTTSNDCANLSPTVIFTLLSSTRRRYALHHLSRRVGAVPLGELAEQIALWEGDPTRDRFERIATGLFHTHVPELSEAGVVRYDRERETVALLPAAEELTPYLNLAMTDDIC